MYLTQNSPYCEPQALDICVHESRRKPSIQFDVCARKGSQSFFAPIAYTNSYVV